MINLDTDTRSAMDHIEKQFPRSQSTKNFNKSFINKVITKLDKEFGVRRSITPSKSFTTLTNRDRSEGGTLASAKVNLKQSRSE